MKNIRYIHNERIKDSTVLRFGKYKGYTIKHIEEFDPEYVDWVLSGPFLSNVIDDSLNKLKEARNRFAKFEIEVVEKQKLAISK